MPDTIEHALSDSFEWHHDEVQRELDNLVVEAHDALYDLSRILDQQDKATVLSTYVNFPADTEIEDPSNSK